MNADRKIVQYNPDLVNFLVVTILFSNSDCSPKSSVILLHKSINKMVSRSEFTIFMVTKSALYCMHFEHDCPQRKAWSSLFLVKINLQNTEESRSSSFLYYGDNAF